MIFALAYALPLNHLSMLYVMTGLFIIGRILFILGYLKFPIYRAFGFGITFIPMVIAAVYIIV